MISFKRIREHLQHVFLILGAIIAVIVLLGLILAEILGGGLTNDPLAHSALTTVVLLPILICAVAIPLVGARFLRDLYKIKCLRDAYNYLARTFFGAWSFGPFAKVVGGKIVLGEGSALHKVGGPGFLIVYHDSAVITEKNGKLYRVLDCGFPELEPFEKIWEIIDLRPQHWVYEVSAVTRDGIPISCEAEVHFKIDDREMDELGRPKAKDPTEDRPYPYTKEAVFRAATSGWVRPPDWQGRPMDWAGRVVIGFTEGVLRDILAEYRLDWLIAPTGDGDTPPREVIRQRLEDQLQLKAPNVGAKILHVNLGDIQIQDERISRQWLEAWQAEWESRALVTRAEGEAELFQMDMAHAQAQAEMVIALTQALQTAAPTVAEAKPYLLATRFIQALHWLSYDPYTRAHMPPEAMETLGKLRKAIERTTPPLP